MYILSKIVQTQTHIVELTIFNAIIDNLILLQEKYSFLKNEQASKYEYECTKIEKKIRLKKLKLI